MSLDDDGASKIDQSGIDDDGASKIVQSGGIQCLDKEFPQSAQNIRITARTTVTAPYGLLKYHTII